MAIAQINQRKLLCYRQSKEYRNGKVELAEIPQDITESQVFVTFFKPQSASIASQFMSFGMFSGSQQSTEADFRDGDLEYNHIELVKTY